METICRYVPDHWCAECCDGRNCPAFGELKDGTWGCLTHPDKPAICKEVNCLVEMGVTFEKAVSKIEEFPEGEFFASNLKDESD